MIARIVTWSVERRWLVLLLTALAAIVGATSLPRLPIDAVPDITNNQVQVNVRAPALSPELIEKQVAFPIETALAGIPGLESTRSLSRNGFAQVTAVFTDATDIYFARAQVQERLTGAQQALPEGVVPAMGPIATGLGEVYVWILRYAERAHERHRPGEPGLQPDASYITPEGDRLAGEADKATYLHTVQDWIVAPQVKGVEGVAGIDSLGGFERGYLVIPDVQKLAALRLSLADLSNALERANVAVGGGTVDRNGEGLSVRADARIASLAQLAQAVIATREGTPIPLAQVAEVRLGQGMRMGSASEGGHEVVTGTAIMRIGENSRTVSTGVGAKLRLIEPSLPPDVVIEPVLDRTRLVYATIATVARNLAEGAALVIVVLFALLGNWRAALIAAAVIPVTMLLTGFGMGRLGVSANLMSLGALDFGLIVDGAVIIVENAARDRCARTGSRHAGPHRPAGAGSGRDARDDPARADGGDRGRRAGDRCRCLHDAGSGVPAAAGRGRRAGLGLSRAGDLDRAEPADAVPDRAGTGGSAGDQGRLLAHRHGGDRLRSDAAERHRHLHHDEGPAVVARPVRGQGGCRRADRAAAGRRPRPCL